MQVQIHKLSPLSEFIESVQEFHFTTAETDEDYRRAYGTMQLPAGQLSYRERTTGQNGYDVERQLVLRYDRADTEAIIPLSVANGHYVFDLTGQPLWAWALESLAEAPARTGRRLSLNEKQA